MRLSAKKGTVEVEHTRDGSNPKAEITLPAGVSEEIVRNGQRSALHEGKQALTLH